MSENKNDNNFEPSNSEPNNNENIAETDNIIFESEAQPLLSASKEPPPKSKKSFWKLGIWQAPGYVGYKISAVLIALMIWVFVISTQNPAMEKVFNVPLQVRNLDAELAMLETINQVQVRVQGSNTDLGNLSASDIVVYIDLQGVLAGSANIEVKVAELPENVQVVSLNPSSIPVELEAVASAVFDLSVRNNVTVAENYKALDPVASPSQITLYGAEKYLDNVASVFVAAEVSGLTANYNQNLQVRVVDFSGNDVTDHFIVSPAVVNVVIPVVTDRPSKSIAVNASLVGVPAEGYQVSQVIVEPATVIAFGDLQALNSIYYLETEPLNITGLTSNYTQTVNIVHSNDIEISQSTVTVVVQIEAVASQTFELNAIFPQNLPAYLSCNLPSPTITVEVSGPQTNIDALTDNDIVPYINFSGITAAGVYQLPLGATLPANITLVSISPANITVTVDEAEE